MPDHNPNLNFLVVVLSFFFSIYFLDLNREVEVSLCVKGRKVTYLGIEVKPSDRASSDRCVSKPMTKLQWHRLRDETYRRARERKRNERE